MKDNANIGVRVLSQLIQRTGLAHMLGQRFQGKRDYYQIFGYETQLTYQMMLAKYLRQGVAARIVDAPAQGIWDDPPQVTSNSQVWNDAWNRLVVKHNLWQTFLRVDKLAGLGQYSCMAVGFRDGGATDRPVPPMNKSGLREVLYFQAYSQESAQIEKIEGDSQSAQYMKPQTYSMYPFKQNEGTLLPGFSTNVPAAKFHHSRVLHVVENPLENEVFGSPRLERVFNDLDDLLKISGGTSETIWLTANRGMQVDIDKEMDLTPEDAKNLTDELEEYMHQIRRYVRTRGIKINSLGSDVPNTDPAFNMLISLISGASGIPRRILIGAEAGQLASDQDRANWAEKVQFRRTEFAEPTVIMPFIAMMTHADVLPTSSDLEITVKWPDAHKLSPLELAQKNAQHARSATNFSSAIEKLAKLQQGEPGTEGTIDPETGEVVPGTAKPAVPGQDYTDILNVDWMKRMLGQDEKRPNIDDPGDLKDL